MDGFSSSDLKTASQRAPTAPSTTLWSQLIVTDITFALWYLVVIAYACMAGVPGLCLVILIWERVANRYRLLMCLYAMLSCKDHGTWYGSVTLVLSFTGLVLAYPIAVPSSTIILFSVAPTARMQD